MSKILKATHQGKLDIGGIIIPCAVLEDGTRVLSEKSLAKALGAMGSGHYWKQKQKGAVLPRYLYAKFLLPYISNELTKTLSNSTVYEGINKVKSTGVPAELLPDICDVWIQADKKGAIPTGKEETAENAYRLLKGFSIVGITALVDEATGYQKVRRRNELNEILTAYISPELLPWAKRFPVEFYQEIFRLKNWPYEPGSVKRPGVIGTWTNKYVYELLPPGVLDELKKKTPKDAKGRRVHQYHRLLSIDVGNPHLEKQLVAVMTLFRAASNWRVFEGLAARAFGKQKQLDLNEDEPET